MQKIIEIKFGIGFNSENAKTEKSEIQKEKIKSNKAQPTESITKISKGSTDSSGNKITNVLAKQDEYAIYEIEDENPGNRLRYIIDGHTDESERALINRLNRVKRRYIEAKVLLGKSSNYGMMAQRIAHTLSTCLSSNEHNDDAEFIELIKNITREHENLVTNRIIYLVPSFIIISFSFILTISLLTANLSHTPAWSILTSILAASLGGGLSILINAKSLNFEEFQAKSHYILLGLERSMLALITGAIAFTGIKSGIIFPSFTENGYWNTMVILIFSGFSESFIPSILQKISDKNQ